MRIRRKWLIVSVVAGVALRALGVMGGTALAQTPTPTPGTQGAKTSPWSDFASRVSTILGIDQSKVQSAMNQAAKDMQDAQLKTKLDALVKAGKMTQAQEDQYLQWYASRPQNPDGTPFGGPFVGKPFAGPGGPGGHEFRRGGPFMGGRGHAERQGKPTPLNPNSTPPVATPTPTPQA